MRRLNAEAGHETTRQPAVEVEVDGVAVIGRRHFFGEGSQQAARLPDASGDSQRDATCGHQPGVAGEGVVVDEAICSDQLVETFAPPEPNTPGVDQNPGD